MELVAVELGAVELGAVEAGGSYLSATYRKPLFISNLHKALIYQQLTKSDFYSIFGTKNWGFGATLKAL